MVLFMSVFSCFVLALLLKYYRFKKQQMHVDKQLKLCSGKHSDVFLCFWPYPGFMWLLMVSSMILLNRINPTNIVQQWFFLLVLMLTSSRRSEYMKMFRTGEGFFSLLNVSYAFELCIVLWWRAFAPCVY